MSKSRKTDISSLFDYSIEVSDKLEKKLSHANKQNKRKKKNRKNKGKRTNKKYNKSDEFEELKKYILFVLCEYATSRYACLGYGINAWFK